MIVRTCMKLLYKCKHEGISINAIIDGFMIPGKMLNRPGKMLNHRFRDYFEPAH